VGNQAPPVGTLESPIVQPPVTPGTPARADGRREGQRPGEAVPRASADVLEETRVKRMLIALAGVATVSAAGPDLEWRLYLAAIAAADGATA
jgi:hypothetical protein